MTFQESIPIAKELAENELKKHFDADAFIILALIDKMNIDLVPDSNVEILLSTIRKMLSELYMTCDITEKQIFKKHLETLQNITQPNII